MYTLFNILYNTEKKLTVYFQVQEYLLLLIGVDLNKTTVETLACTVLPLKHLCRLKIRNVLRKKMGWMQSSKYFLNMLNSLKIPTVIKDYLRYT